MALFDKEGHLTVKDKHFIVGDLQEKLVYVKGEYISKFLQDIGLNIPRKMRMAALKNILKEAVEKTIEERKTLADEMGYRLTWFSRYTDTQLVNLLEWYKSPSLSLKYLEDFWKLLLPYLVEKGVAENDLLRLFDHAEQQAKSGERVLTKEFNDALDKNLYDEQHEIDGVSQDAFRPVTYKASTLTELRAIGEKFNAPIPKRLKKNEMLDIILKKLQERGELTKDLEEKLKNQNIILLERYAKDHDIKVSTELKKEEIIEFILSNAKETKATYYVPSSSAVYEKQIEEVEASTPVQETVVAPVVIPVEEKKAEPQPQMQPAAATYVQAVDYREQFDRLAKAFETLADVISKKEFVVNLEANPVINVEAKAAEPQQVVVEKESEQPQPVQEPAQKVSLIESMKGQIIAELLKDDDDFPESTDHVSITESGSTVSVITEKPVTLDNKELEKVADAVEAKVAPKKGKKVKKQKKVKSTTGGIHPFLLFLTVLLLLVSVGAHGYLLYLAITETFVSTVQPYITFFDLTSLEGWMWITIFGVTTAINVFALLVAGSKKLSKGKAVFISLLLALTLAIPEALLFLITHLTKRPVTAVVDMNDPVGRIVHAINNINIRTGSAQKKGKGFFGTLFSIIGWLIVLAALAALIVFALWRLEFTYGYETIEFIGPFLRDSVMIPIFGSSHYLAA
ncbi:hypothetical protein JV173_03480 [Acholeplasma equirhinis]|uniref:hypothetical protein n=1 Tax=Acholeplasma equirhinis TaxID=555393 RepID=UPI00197AD6DA|nr:hypothetical protein [Acholeplasma equirhinis]MBN3490571.1 hypothetical protein [Acholeplasma equirhinis]